ncbi:MAG: right-handed parallel beta-helix repeat-containing protein [Elainella sp. Prado103]|jgi:hypothetical protein|nr:right-handed parallel beta-helix repeat-containing protein [Elainella sp. Prado103]
MASLVETKYGLVVALWLGLTLPSIAQTASTQPSPRSGSSEVSQATAPETSDEQPANSSVDSADSPAPTTVPLELPEGTADDLRISPRLGLRHNSSTGGIDGITRIEGFLPLRQRAGRDLTFLEGSFLLDNDANVGGQLALGHRFYDPQHDRIWGGYFAVDYRDTDQSDFYQLGLGLESLGEVWDFRINGYLPIGDTSQLMNESSFDSGARTFTGFQGHRLLLTNERIRQTSQTWEDALGGFDAEIGARLAHWEDGDLRAFGGLYYYDGSHTDGTFGWRARLAATPVDHIQIGAALQHDDLFGTNVSVSVGVTWPRIHPRVSDPAAETVALRLGESIVRNPSILVNQETETETEIDRTQQPLMNPEEEQPYRFQHVVLGRQGGDGTFERPFGTVQAALAASRSDGNGIVYVDRGNNQTIPAFQIPDRVQVLSQGPVQILAGMPFPGFPSRPVRLPFSPTENFNNGILVQLPFSNDRRFPTITEDQSSQLVTLGDRTVLAGFRLQNASGDAIFGRNITNVELRNNTIRNAERGIFLDNVADSVVLFDNTVIGSTGDADSGQGLLITNRLNDSVEVTIARQRLVNNRVGLELRASGDESQQQGSAQTVDITDTVVENNREQGILLASEQFGNQIVGFEAGTIENNGAEGIEIQANSGSAQEVTIEQSRIARNAGDGIRMIGGIPNGSTTAAQELFVRNNRILENQGDGIHISGNEVVAQEAGIDNNQILNNGGAGIRGIANNVAFQEYVTDADSSASGISDNQISGNGDQGIDLNANNRATLVADLRRNRLENNRTNGRPDLEVTASSNNTDVCVVVTDNTAPGGIRLDNNSAFTVSGLFEVGDLPQVSTRNIGSIEFLPNLNTFTNKPAAQSCFE